MGSRSVNQRLIRPSYGQVQGITHGRQVNATNTGIAKWGLTAGALTAAASGTISANGTVITERRFSSGVFVSGNNVTLRRCLIEDVGAAAGVIVKIAGTNVTLEDCTIRPSSGSCWQAILGEDGTNYSGLLITGCDVSGCENNMSLNDSPSSVTVEYSYFHDSRNTSNPSGHKDCIEVYGGTNVLFSKSRITHNDMDTATFNLAPWSGPSYVDGCNIFDCFIDGGNQVVLEDAQSRDTGGYVRNLRVLRCDVGGHQNPATGRYSAWSQSDGEADADGPPVSRPRHETEAALAAAPNGYLWPSTGPDVNRWAECQDLSPDLTGQIAL